MLFVKILLFNKKNRYLYLNSKLGINIGFGDALDHGKPYNLGGLEGIRRLCQTNDTGQKSLAAKDIFGAGVN
jgi:hypothetical protein